MKSELVRKCTLDPIGMAAYITKLEKKVKLYEKELTIISWGHLTKEGCMVLSEAALKQAKEL